MTNEEFLKLHWAMMYEEYNKCDCTQCGRADCIHRNAYRRLPESDGGLALCPRLNE